MKTTKKKTQGLLQDDLNIAAAFCGGYKKTDMSPEGDIAMNERGTSMEIKEECLAYLGQYYKELFSNSQQKIPFHDRSGLKTPFKPFKPGNFKRVKIK